MLIDKELEKAIKEYLEETSKWVSLPDNSGEFDLSVLKQFKGYILKTQPAGYKFETPLYAWWDVTSACNFRCVHCLYSDTTYNGDNDLTYEESMRLIDELINDFGIVQIILTGGEIFLKPYIMEIIQKFKANNVAVKLLTNAALITDEQIEELSRLLNPYTDVMQISLDAATKETYKKIRRTELFDKVVSNIDKLVKKGIRVTLGCTVNTINYNEIEDIYRLSEKLNVEAFFAGRMIYYNESHKNLMVSEKDLMLLSARLLKLRNKDNKPLLAPALFSKLELINVQGVSDIIKEEPYRSQILKNNIVMPRSCHNNDRIAIKANGDAYLCLDAECENSSLGNFREKSLLEIWQNKDKNVFFQKRDINLMACKNCEYNKICNSGCMAKAYKKYSSINMPEIECKFYKQ